MAQALASLGLDCGSETASADSDSLIITVSAADVETRTDNWNAFNPSLIEVGLVKPHQSFSLPRRLIDQGALDADALSAGIARVKRYGPGVLFLQTLIRWANSLEKQYGNELASAFILSILNRPGDEKLYFERRVKSVRGTLLSPFVSLEDLLLVLDLDYSTEDIELKYLYYYAYALRLLSETLISSLKDIEFGHVQFAQNFLFMCRDFTKHEEDEKLNQVRFGSLWTPNYYLIFRSYRERLEKNFIFPINLHGIKSKPFNDVSLWGWHTILGGKTIGGGILLPESVTRDVDRDLESWQSLQASSYLEGLKIENSVESAFRHRYY